VCVRACVYPSVMPSISKWCSEVVHYKKKKLCNIYKCGSCSQRYWQPRVRGQVLGQVASQRQWVPGIPFSSAALPFSILQFLCHHLTPVSWVLQPRGSRLRASAFGVEALLANIDGPHNTPGVYFDAGGASVPQWPGQEL
jgi:hypothetical protein